MTPADTRDLDSRIAALGGEAAGQEITKPDPHMDALAPEPWTRVPRSTPQDPTYYDRPLLKESVWSIDIPLYYYLGGAAGAALALGAAVQLASSREARDGDLRTFSKYCHWMGIIGSTAGAGFLIHDLGKPSRFLAMVRVFRPTSPMNMGAWILGGAAPAAIVTGILINRPGFLGAVGEATGYISGIFGTALAGYTGVLVSNTAIPIWQESRRWMPVLFTASAAATAASILDLLHDNERANRITFLFGNMARLVEVAAAKRVEATAGSKVARVAEPLRRGAPSTLWKAATILTAASLVVSAIPSQSSRKRKLAGLLGAVGSFCLRFAVHYATNASARDPRASFQLQRSK